MLREAIFLHGHTLKALENEDTLLPHLLRTHWCPQQMFPSLRAQGNVMSNNVSATMCPRLPLLQKR